MKTGEVRICMTMIPTVVEAAQIYISKQLQIESALIVEVTFLLSELIAHNKIKSISPSWNDQSNSKNETNPPKLRN